MSGKLLLTSTGFGPEINDHFKTLISKTLEDTIVAFIATAADPYEDKHFVEYDRNVVKEMGMHIKEIDLKLEDKESLLVKFSNCDVIYVCGGNTFYLLDWARRSGFDKVAKKMLDSGKVYMGVSAGSILAGPDIAISGWDPTWDKNTVNIKDTKSLNLVPFAISPHFIEGHRGLLVGKSKEVSYPIVAIDDTQAVLCENGRYKIVGNGEKIYFNGFKESV